MTVTLPLLARDGTVRAYASVDDSDAEAFSRYTWRLSPNGYARRSAGTRHQHLLMHRVVLGLETGDPLCGDHINGDRLDNRRENLRVVDRTLNTHNRGSRGGASRFRGVSWSMERCAWRATAMVNGRCYFGGAFVYEEEAARAADELRTRLMAGAVPGRLT